ncbi:MAG: rod shape-determining protein MreD [Dehalococcoidia bacterium]
MNTALLVALAFAAVLVDVAAAPGATVFAVRPQLTLVLIALWSVLRPSAEVMLLAPAAGIMLGLLGNEALGVSVLALAPIVVLGISSTGRSTERRIFTSIGLVVAGTLAYALIHAILNSVLGRPFPLEFGSLRMLVILCVVNAALAAMLYWPLARLPSDTSMRDEIRRY